ncbi:extracellular solute-binding protein [Neiella sp. HB171785]|uniref:Extracellular solute-binding protein n=1 Tax=Neiella litorisoli TaxID=2771431 RepID=A0A8J6R2Q7_9GAMM|nr:extracellular solute-binding protein [Neiella litorisoli]MBD1389320.1 extracellular solute-binding protein [Neiella litorisoli]
MKTLLLLLSCWWMTSAAASELLFWHQKEEARAWFPQIAKQYEAATGVRIKVSYLPTGELKTNLMRAVFDGNSPHAAMVPADFIGDHRRLGLRPLADNVFAAGMPPAALQLATYDGNRYGVPLLGGNHLMLFYNKKFVEAPATSWAELVAQRSQVERKGSQLIGWKYAEMYWFVSFMSAFGAFPVDDNAITLDTPETRQALSFYKQIADDGLVDSSCGYGCSYDDFKNGKYAYAINGDWAFKDVSTSLGDDFGVALLPTINGRPMVPMFSGMVLIFPNQDLAGETGKRLTDFAHYLQSQNIQQRFYDDIGSLPVHPQVVDRIQQTATANMQALLEQLQHAKAAPPTPAMAAAWIGMRKGFELYMSGHGSLEKATQLMQRFSEHELKKATKTNLESKQ